MGKIKGHGRNSNGKKCAPESWILAVDPFCGMDLLRRATRAEAQLARSLWGQGYREEFDRPVAPPIPIPAADGEGPAVQPQVALPPVPPPFAEEKEKEEKVEKSSPNSNPEEAPKNPNIIDPSMFKVATQSLDERAKAFLENETQLRNLRLQSLPKPTVESPTDNMVPNDGSRDKWKRSTKISVWSETDQKWLLGVVVSIQEEGGLFEKLEVHYKRNGQRHKKYIPRYHKSMKRRVGQNESPPRPASPERSNNSDIAEGWTEHFDSNRERFYYYSKATRKTVWDKEALELGIIKTLRR